MAPNFKDILALFPEPTRAQYKEALATIEVGLADARVLDTRLKERFPNLPPALRNALSVAGVVLNR